MQNCYNFNSVKFQNFSTIFRRLLLWQKLEYQVVFVVCARNFTMPRNSCATIPLCAIIPIFTLRGGRKRATWDTEDRGRERGRFANAAVNKQLVNQVNKHKRESRVSPTGIASRR